ncbi:hypothetical protein GQX74_008851 [Glossina fuscipes]|nr:hypothetical protein GQX74_008851 [Glossina fuscipes]
MAAIRVVFITARIITTIFVPCAMLCYATLRYAHGEGASKFPGHLQANVDNDFLLCCHYLYGSHIITWQPGKQTDRQAGMQAGRKAGKQGSREASRRSRLWLFGLRCKLE